MDNIFIIHQIKGIRVEDAAGIIVYSDDWRNCSVTLMLQDDDRTLKIFINEPYDGSTELTGINAFNAVTRVSVINGFMRFERYGMYDSGCSMHVSSSGLLHICPLASVEADNMSAVIA